MSLINLLPSSKKHFKAVKTVKNNAAKIALFAPKKMLFIPTAVLLLLVISWMALFIHVRGREKKLSLLDKELSDFKSSNKQTEYINKKKSELNDKLSFYEKALGEETTWSKLLSLINEAVPNQVWLTGIYTQSDPNRSLVITGSAASVIESKMIVAISAFTNRLKNYPYFRKAFEEIKLGAISLDKKGSLNVMNFSLLSRFKP